MRKPPKSDPQDSTPRGGRARSVAEIVPDIGRVAFRRFGFVQSAVITRWAEIVGARYAAVSAPQSIRFAPGKRADGTLTMTVAGAHAPMMQHIAPTIIERVNRFFGYSAIARISIRQGEIMPPVQRVAAPKVVNMPIELGESLRTVADPELRAVLESLARSVAAVSTVPVLGRVS